MENALIDTIPLSVTDTTATYMDTAERVLEPTVTSLFHDHKLQPSPQFACLERSDPGTGFVFLILFICAAITIYLQRNSDGIFGSIFKAGFDSNQAAQDARVENSQRSRNLIILQVLAALSISLFAAGTLVYAVGSSNVIKKSFFTILGALTAFILFKKLVLWLLAQVFELRQELKIHQFNLNVLFSITGVMLLPLILFIFFSSEMPEQVAIYTGIVAVGFFYLKGLQRGFGLAINSTSVSVLHLFYYFCALEILPLFILIRIVQELQ